MKHTNKIIASILTATFLLGSAIPTFAAEDSSSEAAASSAPVTSSAASSMPSSSLPDTPTDSSSTTTSSTPDTPSSSEPSSSSSQPENPPEPPVTKPTITASEREFSMWATDTKTITYTVTGTHEELDIQADSDKVKLDTKKATDSSDGNDVYTVSISCTDKTSKKDLQTAITAKLADESVPAVTSDFTVKAVYVLSDTTVNFEVTQGLTYAFRFEVVGPQGLEPSIVAGNSKVLQTENVRKVTEKGHDVYYFQVRATGKPGEASAIYTQLPGQDSVKHCTITVGKPYIKSDTTVNFTVTQGKTYGFRFEVMGPKGMNPNIVAGNGNVLQTEKVRKVVENGHDVYYFTVRATGKPGESSSIYTQLPGQDGVKHCAIKVGKPYIKSDTTVDFNVVQGLTYGFRFEVVGPKGMNPNIAAGNGNILRTENVRKVTENGNDVYYFTVRATGKPGEASSIYTQLPGQDGMKHCAIKVAPPYIKSDTTNDFTVPYDKTYGFRFEVVGQNGLQPNITAGNSKVLRTENVRKVTENGRDVYYFSVRAVGQPGEASSIYTQLPGQEGVKHCAIKVGPCAGTVRSDTGSFKLARGSDYTYKFTVQGTHVTPKFSTSNANVLQISNTKKAAEKSADVYYVRVKGLGNINDTAILSAVLPGQKPVESTVTIDKPAPIAVESHPDSWYSANGLADFGKIKKYTVAYLQSKGYYYDSSMDGLSDRTHPSSTMNDGLYGEVKGNKHTMEENIRLFADRLIARIQAHNGPAKYGVYRDTKYGYTCFIYQTDGKINESNAPDFNSNANWYNTPDQIGRYTDKSIGCNPYAVGRAAEKTGIDLGWLTADEIQDPYGTGHSALDYINSRGLKVSTVPRKDSIGVVLGSGTFISHYFYVENVIQGNLPVLVSESSAGTGYMGMHSASLDYYGSNVYYIYLPV